MEKFIKHKGIVAPLDRANVDTDQIIPKQFLKRIERTGFGEFAFFDWRYLEDGIINPDFILNDIKYKKASILISGRNFGSGSSREHAPWALYEMGFKVIIAPSFADIFRNNCMQNGLLTIVLEDEIVDMIMAKSTKSVYDLTIDLQKQTIRDSEKFSTSFEIDNFRKECLLEGLDDIDLSFRMEEEINKFESLRLPRW